MIAEEDPMAPRAISLLAKELERIHRSKRLTPKYKKGNSPDEKKMIKYLAKAQKILISV